MPKPAARRTQADRTEISAQRMLASALRLLVRDGVRGTTLAALGRGAGYSRGLATHRFGSKAGLLRQVLQRASSLWLAHLSAHVGTKTGAEAMCAAVDAHLDLLRHNPDEVRAMYLLWFTSIDPSSDYRANVARVHRAQRADVCRWIRLGEAQGRLPPGVEAERIAEQFCASMVGIVFQWLVNARMPLESMHHQLKLDLRRLLSAPARPPRRSPRFQSQRNPP